MDAEKYLPRKPERMQRIKSHQQTQEVQNPVGCPAQHPAHRPAPDPASLLRQPLGHPQGSLRPPSLHELRKERSMYAATSKPC